MTKSRTFKRALTVITVLALIICFAQTAVFADNTVEITSGTWDGSKIHVTGAISTKGAEITMLAVRTDDQNVELSDYETPDELAAAVQFIDQDTVKSDDLTLSWEFALRDGSEGNWVVVFMSGTDANLTKLAISLENVITGVNGTVTFAEGTDFVGSLPTPLFTLEGGDDDWADQLEVTVTDAEDNPVDATVDKENGTVSFEAPFEKATYTVTIANTDEGYPALSKTKTFTFISEEGAAAAEAIAELNELPANLGVTVDKGEDAYTITLPEDTENVTFTATVDGEATEDNPLVVDRADEGTKTVVVTATANGTDVTKTYSVTVQPKGVVGPAIAEEDVEIITAKNGVYNKYRTGINVIATIAAGDIDPATSKVFVGGVEFYYVATRNYFVGIVPEYADKAALIADVEVVDEPSDTIRYGKDPAADQSKPLMASDFGVIKRISLMKIDNPTDKQLLFGDVAAGKMDGNINAADFGAVKRVVLKKAPDLEINTAQ